MILDLHPRSAQLKMEQLGQPSTSRVSFLAGTQSKENRQVGNFQHRQMQLQFNRNVPTLPSNLAFRYSIPNPIVIEKLRRSNEHTRDDIDGDGRSSNNSTPFSVVSEENLNLAIKLAKRDIKRRNLEEKVKENFAKEDQNKSHSKTLEQSKKETCENVNAGNKSKTYVRFKRGEHAKQAAKAEITSSGARVYVYTPDRGNVQQLILDSPPTHDPGPGPKASPKAQADKSVQEVRRLQKELSKYIHKIEELAKKDRTEEILEPDEERRGRIRRQEQSARSARMLYVLQQQVKEIQEDLEKLSPQKIKHTKKTRTLTRLAAVHRGAIRALQIFVTQLTDQADLQVPAHYKELGHLIRQLSLCSAKLEGTVDSSLSDTIISILQQVEDLESIMEKKRTPQKMKNPSRARSKSSSSREGSPGRRRSASPRKGKKPPPVSKEHVILGQKRPPVVRKLLIDENEPASGFPATVEQTINANTKLDNRPTDAIANINRNTILKAGIAALIQEQRHKSKHLPETAPLRNKGVLVPERPQGFRQPRKSRPGEPNTRHARFQEKTLASKLKETQATVKELKTPWIPPHPTSPPASPKRVNSGKKISFKDTSDGDQGVLPVKAEVKTLAAAEEEAIRLAWLDSVTARTLKELNLMRKQEMDRIQSARPDKVDSAELQVDNHLQCQIDKTKPVAQRVDLLSEKIMDEILEDTALDLWSMERGDSLRSEAMAMQDSSSLEIMLHRMEEMERSQDSVRRRFHQIVYSDPEFWAKEEKEGRDIAPVDRKPASPRPIRITRTVGHKDPKVDIILEEPHNATDGSIDEELKSESESDLHPVPQKMFWPKEGCTFLTVPRQMLKSIYDNKDRYEQHLKLISHEVVGSFDPWHITESIAEELLEDALEDVAAELQDLCEGYAEAVFTSEFLQPVQ
ncbi:protein moonraker [Lissotriton helveticus]